MTTKQRQRTQAKAKTKTPRRPKAPGADFWSERAAKIAASRAANEKSGLTERQRRALRAAERAGTKLPKGAKAKLAAIAAKHPKTTKKKTCPDPIGHAQVRLRSDATKAAYIARLTKAIAKTDRLKSARDYVGSDAGHGWIIVATDGSRALLQQGTATNTTRPKTGRELVSAAGPKHGIDLTPDVERALRSVGRGHVALRVDGPKKTLRITPFDPKTPSVVAPVQGKPKTTSINVDVALLLDACGRGGALMYDDRPDRVVVMTPDDLRYVLMGVRHPVAPTKQTKATTKTPKTKTPTTEAAPTPTPDPPQAPAAPPAAQ